MSVTRIMCYGGCGFPQAYCNCKPSHVAIADTTTVPIMLHEHTMPAPVSATEPEVLGYWRDDACKRADLDADDIVSDISVSVAREIVTHIDTLRARLAEAERVTEEQVERAAPHVYDAMRSFDAEGARYPWVAGGNSDMQDRARRVVRAAITAARGGG